MKALKLLIIMLIATLAFNGANAQIHLPPHPPPPPLPKFLRHAPPRPPSPFRHRTVRKRHYTTHRRTTTVRLPAPPRPPRPPRP